MGRWSQARHRGRGGPSPSHAMVAAPAGDDWDLNQDGSNVVVSLLNPAPAGADGMGWRWRVSPLGDWSGLAVATGDLDSPQLLIEDTGIGDSFDVEAAWVSGSDLVSPWSALKNIVIAP